MKSSQRFILPTVGANFVRLPLKSIIVDKATEGLLHLHLPQNTVTLARQRVVEVADPYKPTSHWKHKISTAIGSPAG